MAHEAREGFEGPAVCVCGDPRCTAWFDDGSRRASEPAYRGVGTLAGICWETVFCPELFPRRAATGLAGGRIAGGWVEEPIRSGEPHMSELDERLYANFWLAADLSLEFGREVEALADAPEPFADMDGSTVYPPGPDDECGASWTTGGHDPYGTSCVRPVGHMGDRHEGPCPFQHGCLVSWGGGGTCAGDPLPYEEVRHTLCGAGGHRA